MSEKSLPDLSTRRILIFWLPLAMTWLLMAIEQPYLTAVIARLPQAKFNLAAFGVAYAFALIAEAPVIMLMSASTALVTDGASFQRMRRFTFMLNAGVTALLLLVLIPGVFNFVMGDLIGLTGPVRELVAPALLVMAPWPAAIGYRRFHQGILIRGDRTRRVAYGTVIRLVTMSLTALVLFRLRWNGALVGAAALSAGVVAEAAVSHGMARSLIRDLQSGRSEKAVLAYGEILKFYIPLAMTSLLALGVHPLVTFFLGRSRFPIESLAVLPVVNSLVFLFRAMGLSFQEVLIALEAERLRNHRRLARFATILAGAVTLGLALFAFTPLGRVWFETVAGLSPDLARFAYIPLRILVILPALSVWMSFQRGSLVTARDTTPITLATGVEIGIILLVLGLAVGPGNMIGVTAAAIAFITGRLVANFLLLPRQVRAVARLEE